MKKDDPIFVAGHRGMVGSAIVRVLQDQGYTNVVTRTRTQVPLDDLSAVTALFAKVRPAYVFVAAARVGGIMANMTQGADFIHDNLRIQTNIIDTAWRQGTRKLLFLGSSCIYPKQAEQPIREDALLSAPLEPTNLPYAVAKIAGKVMCDAYRQQHGFNAFTVMPPNIYGVGDNFHPEHSHVVAGMMRRFHEAKLANSPEVTVWGSGKPLRELMTADDLAEACVFLMNTYEDGGMINAGSAQETSIHDLAHLMARVVGYKGKIVFDSTKPDGTPRKIMDSSRIHALGWRAQTCLESGLNAMYAWWLDQESGRHNGGT